MATPLPRAVYGLVAVKWHLVDDFRRLVTGRIGSYRVRRPTRADLVLLMAGKAIFFSWAFGVPLLFHPVSTVLVHYGSPRWCSGTPWP
jgi:linoleoyl-CoA desaturase